MKFLDELRADFRAVSPEDVAARLARLENDPWALRAWAWRSVEADVRRERRWKQKAYGLGARGLGAETFLDFLVHWTFLLVYALYLVHKQAKDQVDKTFYLP